MLVPLLILVACASGGTGSDSGLPAHHLAGGGFRNLDPTFARASGWTRWTFILRRGLQSLMSPRRFDAPRVANDGAPLRAGSPSPTITWVGHATLLVQLQGVNVLTDPQWSERASPFSWAGPRRLTPVGLAFEDLPPIHVVVISHDHYDSLDVDTIRRLAATHRPRFLVPLGLAAWMADMGVTEVDELDWWDSRRLHGLTFTSVPAQHWSARTRSETR